MYRNEQKVITKKFEKQILAICNKQPTGLHDDQMQAEFMHTGTYVLEVNKIGIPLVLELFSKAMNQLISEGKITVKEGIYKIKKAE